jgi:hypothetical protein
LLKGFSLKLIYKEFSDEKTIQITLLMSFKTLAKLCLFLAISSSALATDVVISSNTVTGQTFSSGTNSIQINTGVSLSKTGSNAIYVGGGSLSILNNGSISTDYYTIQNRGTISSLINNGSISTSPGLGGYFPIFTYGTITTLTNLGTITSEKSNIYNLSNLSTPEITTLNNLQGASGSALTFESVLPINYNIIINSASDFGKIIFTLPSGSTTFGISSLTGTNIGVTGTRYQNVISGLASNLITNENTLLTYTNGQLTATYKLVTDDLSVANTWDLLILSMLNGPSAADTQSSLANQSRRLRSTFNSTMASANFANMNTYDCNLFDKNNMCISAGGRYTNIDNPSSNNSAAVVVLGYKVSPNIRIGGFLDQSVNNNTPTGINVSNKNPMMGGFLYWNQNADGLGYQVKIANAYQDKDLSTTRDVIGTSEVGTGKTNLNTQSYVGELSYAFNYLDSTIVRPYFALRYTNIKQDAYTEDTSASVTAPLTYAKLGDRSTTALMGVKLNHALTPRTNLTASLGIEQDINHKTDQLVASGVADLTSENFNNNIKRRRPVVSAGAYYAVAKNQRLSGEVYYQQLPFQSTGSATAYVNYMIGF